MPPIDEAGVGTHVVSSQTQHLYDETVALRRRVQELEEVIARHDDLLRERGVCWRTSRAMSACSSLKR